MKSRQCGLIVRVETSGGRFEDSRACPLPHVEEVRRAGLLLPRTRLHIRESEDGYPERPAPRTCRIESCPSIRGHNPSGPGVVQPSSDGHRPGRIWAKTQATGARRGPGFSVRTVDKRVRPYCPFPSPDPSPPNLISLIGHCSLQGNPAGRLSRDRLPLQERHGLTRRCSSARMGR